MLYTSVLFSQWLSEASLQTKYSLLHQWLWNIILLVYRVESLSCTDHSHKQSSAFSNHLYELNPFETILSQTPIQNFLNTVCYFSVLFCSCLVCPVKHRVGSYVQTPTHPSSLHCYEIRVWLLSLEPTPPTVTWPTFYWDDCWPRGTCLKFSLISYPTH